jgi:MFS family permease
MSQLEETSSVSRPVEDSAVPSEPVLDERSLKVPPLIRRNTILLTLAEMFVGTGQQMVPTLGSIVVYTFLGSATFAGISSSMIGLTRALVSYPSGYLADRRGRKPVLLLGLVLSLVGAVGMGTSILQSSFALYLLGLLIFGIGSGTSQQQRRLAAADMYPPARRGEGLGFVLTGALIGALGGPAIINVAEGLGRSLGVNQMAVAWLIVPVLIIPSIVLIVLIRPDPQEIATRLERFYPGYRPTESTDTTIDESGPVTLATFVRSYPQLVAFVSMFILYANMSMMMSLAPLHMSNHGMPLSEVSLTVAGHVVGMFGFSIPIGRLVDQLGRRSTILLGIAISTVGTILAALGESDAAMMVGLFLVGVGWSFGNVSTAALIADTTAPSVRGRAMGANITFGSAASVVSPVIGGVLLERFGPLALVLISMVAMIAPVVLVVRLRETSPGQYASEGVVRA